MEKKNATESTDLLQKQLKYLLCVVRSMFRTFFFHNVTPEPLVKYICLGLGCPIISGYPRGRLDHKHCYVTFYRFTSC